jgi:hypothetical protein
MTKKPEGYPLRYTEDFSASPMKLPRVPRSLGKGGGQTIKMPDRKSFFTTVMEFGH